MVLVFLLFYLLLILALITFILLLSSIKVKIEKLHISNVTEKFNTIFISKVSILMFNKLKIFETKIDNKKVKKIFKNSKLDLKKIRYTNIINIIKNSKIYLENLNIEGYLGLENAVYTSYIISFINTMISIALSKRAYKYNPKRYKYIITPVYTNQNIVNLEINCIITIDIVHIINILIKLLKKGRVKKYERTSDRRTYAYSNE